MFEKRVLRVEYLRMYGDQEGCEKYGTLGGWVTASECQLMYVFTFLLFMSCLVGFDVLGTRLRYSIIEVQRCESLQRWSRQGAIWTVGMSMG